jgi:hypothetical protein
MPSEKDLAEKALRTCREHAAKTLKGDLFIEIVSAEKEWDKVQLRTVFDQSMVIWKRYGGFDVILDRHGLVAGFVDHQSYRDTGDLEMSARDLPPILAGERLIPPGAVMIRFAQHRPAVDTKTYKATYRLRHPTPDYDGLEVEVNPKKKTLIAVRPVMLPEDDR